MHQHTCHFYDTRFSAVLSWNDILISIIELDIFYYIVHAKKNKELIRVGLSKNRHCPFIYFIILYIVKQKLIIQSSAKFYYVAVYHIIQNKTKQN